MEPDSLSARVLKAKYFPSCDFLQAELGGAPSQIWRAVLNGRDTLKQGIIWRVGDGQSTNIWQHNWIPRASYMRSITSRTIDPPQLVSELITVNGDWNHTMLAEVFVFLQIDVDAILAIPLCIRELDDFLSWAHENNGVFTVRSILVDLLCVFS